MSDRHPKGSRDLNATSSDAAWWVLGPEWASHGLRQPGWLLLPLRVFLGFTFTYAGLQKLANPAFFDASSASSVQHQMRLLAPTSPIGPLVDLSLHAGFVVGLLIALGELAVGIGTLLGLRARLAATGGALLALTFFLTVSWNTTPYYYGADIVFFFAWIPFTLVGSAGVLSVDAWLAGKVNTLDQALDMGRQSPQQRAHGRRAVLLAGLGTLAIGGLSAVAGRLAGGGSRTAPTTATTPIAQPRGSASPHAGPSSAHPSPPAGMELIGSANAVRPGQGGTFRDPATGQPAWLVRLSHTHYVAFSAVCTHAGCTVNYDAADTRFVCPCHGGTFSARTGRVLAGPPPAPLHAIPVKVTGGHIYVK